MSSVHVDTAPVAPETGGSSRRPQPVQAPAQSGKAGWLVKVVLTVLCLLWLVPIIGLSITSFRPLDDANSSGWWTVFASPFTATPDAATTTTKAVPAADPHGDRLHQQLRDRAAGDVHPDPDRGVRGVRVHVHGVLGP